MSKVGVLTTFFGYKGDVLKKVEQLAKIFEHIDKQPYIQINSSPQNISLEKIANEFNRLSQEYGIKYSVHQSMFLPNDDFFLNLASSNRDIWETSLEACKKSVELARQIGAKQFSMHGGNACEKIYKREKFETMVAENHISYQDAYANFKEGLIELIDFAGRDVAISVENKVHRPNTRHLFTKPEDFLNLPERVSILLDVGHGYYSQIILGDSLFFDKLIKEARITEIHLSDNEGNRDCHWLAGDGVVPIESILKRLLSYQKLPALIIEASKSRWGYTDNDLSNNIIKVYDLLEELKKWKIRRDKLHENYSGILSEP